MLSFKNVLNKIKSRLDSVEEKMGDSNKRSITIAQTESQREKTLKEMKITLMICEIVRSLTHSLESQKETRERIEQK